MKIEWASHFREDGTRRRPPPSSMHGWLAKMRGTLLGNESLRSRGMREMREAESRKQYQKRRQHTAKSGGLLSFLSIGRGAKKGSKLHSKRPTGSARPSYRSTHSHGSRPARPPLRPSGTHRSSQRSPRQHGSSHPHPTRRSTRRS